MKEYTNTACNINIDVVNKNVFLKYPQNRAKTVMH